ncbi:hypothetical protein Syun_009681 [Stephania yunnanensis]|uniref:Uncharacterized protein n=1 Tax=Stephania yunnanensis TaxID=152371 RepID=A0AAP0PP94_9MAGN
MNSRCSPPSSRESSSPSSRGAASSPKPNPALKRPLSPPPYVRWLTPPPEFVSSPSPPSSLSFRLRHLMLLLELIFLEDSQELLNKAPQLNNNRFATNTTVLTRYNLSLNRNRVATERVFAD